MFIVEIVFSPVYSGLIRINNALRDSSLSSHLTSKPYPINFACHLNSYLHSLLRHVDASNMNHNELFINVLSCNCNVKVYCRRA